MSCAYSLWGSAQDENGPVVLSSVGGSTDGSQASSIGVASHLTTAEITNNMACGSTILAIVVGNAYVSVHSVENPGESYGEARWILCVRSCPRRHLRHHRVLPCHRRQEWSFWRRSSLVSVQAFNSYYRCSLRILK